MPQPGHKPQFRWRQRKVSIRDYTQNELTDLGGAVTFLSPEDVPKRNALESQNTSFVRGKVYSRNGFIKAYGSGEPATALFNWISAFGNFLTWYRALDGTIRYIDISASSPATQSFIGTNLNGYACTFTNAGSRLYVCAFDADGKGTSAARVVNYYSSAFHADKAFQGPITYTPSAPTQPGSGDITVGAHRLGYLIRYRTGFTTRPSPDSGATPPDATSFVPVAFTADGDKNASWTLNTTWPTGAVEVQVIMSTVSNPARLIEVPGARATLNGGGSQSVTITFSISDEDLLSSVLSGTGEDATARTNFLTESTGGTAPFVPSCMFFYGDRAVWITRIPDEAGNEVSVAFISNHSAPQEISADQHIYTLPGNLEMVTGCSLAGSLFFFGPSGTFRTSDTGGFPVEWPAAELVDARRGTLAVRGVEVSPAGTYAWVADRSGLYWFQGQYQILPVSYYTTDVWNRINWDAAQCVQIKDDPTNKTVIVAAPLDDATEPNHLLVYDYTSGVGAAEVDFSLWHIEDQSVGAMTLVQNTLSGTAQGTAKRLEIWTAPGARNLSNDPDFDDSTQWENQAAAQPWVIGATAEARTGSNAAVRTTSGGEAAAVSLNTAKVPVVPGQTVYASGWVKSSAGAAGSGGIRLSFFDGDGSLLSSSSSLNSATTSYVQKTFSATAPASTVWARVGVEVSGHTSGTWYVDDVTMGLADVLRLAADEEDARLDMGTPIYGHHQSSLLPARRGKIKVQQHHGVNLRVMGHGTVRSAAWSMDSTRVRYLKELELALRPDKEFYRQFHILSEYVSVSLATNYLPDGRFGSALRWTLGSGWTIDEETAIHAGAGDPSSLVSEVVPVTAGDLYYVSANVRRASGNGLLRYGLRFLNAAGATISAQTITPPVSSAWRRYGEAVKAPALSVEAQFVATVSGKTTGEHMVSDVFCASRSDAPVFTLSGLTHYSSPYVGRR